MHQPALLYRCRYRFETLLKNSSLGSAVVLNIGHMISQHPHTQECTSSNALPTYTMHTEAGLLYIHIMTIKAILPTLLDVHVRYSL